MEQCQRCGADDELYRAYYEENHSYILCEECTNIFVAHNRGCLVLSMTKIDPIIIGSYWSDMSDDQENSEELDKDQHKFNRIKRPEEE